MVASPPLALGINWINPAGGLWRDGANWDNGISPTLVSGTTRITNANTKTVVVDALTPPLNLVITALNLSGPDETTNTLRLEDLGPANPFVVSNATLSMYRGSALVVTNSSLLVTGRAIAFNVDMGEVTLESGSIVVRDEPPTPNVTVFTRIGRTNTATLTINDGTMEASTLRIGALRSASMGRSDGTVYLRGGLLQVAAELSIADGIQCTGLVHMTGGRLQVINNLTNITRVGDYGFGRMIVANAAAELGNVSVARHDQAVGLLVVESGGLVTCSDDLSIGRFSGATGTVVVAGGQLLVTNHAVWVGREGVGELIVSNGVLETDELLVAVVPTNTARGAFTLTGGLVSLSSNLVVGSGDLASGFVEVLGGELDLTSASKPVYITVPSGLMSVRGGTVSVNDLLLTNASGQFVFHSGTLRVRNITASNGWPFVVGDGVNPATLEMLYGTNYFPNGLVISSNATLTGCGVIVGPIINEGTIATNCTPVAPEITAQPQSLTSTNGGLARFSVVATGTPPPGYQWYFNGDALSGATRSSLTISPVALADTGDYTVVVANTSGSVTSAVATLRVLVPPTLGDVSAGGDSFQFSFAGVNGLHYLVEYKDTLNDPSWLVLTNRTGTGAPITVIESPRPGASRFYRVRVE
jgi:T5SS/PEP-CTERM-associated repeat protein